MELALRQECTPPFAFKWDTKYENQRGRNSESSHTLDEQETFICSFVLRPTTAFDRRIEHVDTNEFTVVPIVVFSRDNHRG